MTKTADLEQRLRTFADYSGINLAAPLREAADEIVRMRTRLGTLDTASRLIETSKATTILNLHGSLPKS